MRTPPRLALASLTLLALSACRSESEAPREDAGPTAASVSGECDPTRMVPDSTRTLTITGVTYDHIAQSIQGCVLNYEAVPYDSVGVYFDVIGADRLTRASVADSTPSVAPGGVWTFSIPAGVDSVTYLRVRRYTGTPRGRERNDIRVMRLIPTPRVSM